MGKKAFTFLLEMFEINIMVIVFLSMSKPQHYSNNTGYSYYNTSIVQHTQRTEAIFIGNPNFPKQNYERSSNLSVENFVFTNKQAIGIKYDKLIYTIDVSRTVFYAPPPHLLPHPLLQSQYLEMYQLQMLNILN